MVSLTFEFNKKVLKKLKITEDELLEPVRKFAESKEIIETKHGFFEKDTDNALCVILMIITDVVEENIIYLDCLKSLELDVDGEKEECMESVRKWFDRER